MIDPLHSLAFSVQANPGVYAVLVGSGVSRSARIPTGWEITLDFVRKLAEVAGENCGTDPALWYRERYGKEPDYSDLLDALAKTPAERQQLLRAYLEPSEAERADGLKAPTAGHRAIASLAAKGYIRIIITTNFDRLMGGCWCGADRAQFAGSGARRYAVDSHPLLRVQSAWRLPGHSHP